MSGYDPHDREKQRKQHEAEEQRAAVAELVRNERWLRLMAIDWGRALVHDFLVNDAHIFVDPFHTNAMQMARNSGERAFGVAISSFLQQACPDLWVLMLNEHQNDQ